MRKMAAVRKKKSNFNQPCTDFIDCVVVKTSEKVIQYVGALLFFLCNCFVQGTRCELASVTWRILALRKQVRVYVDLAAGVLQSREPEGLDTLVLHMHVHTCTCVYVFTSMYITCCNIHSNLQVTLTYELSHHNISSYHNFIIVF
jgi:hypothetical protein